VEAAHLEMAMMETQEEAEEVEEAHHWGAKDQGFLPVEDSQVLLAHLALQALQAHLDHLGLWGHLIMHLPLALYGTISSSGP
jgi:hypothetical protein